MIHKRQRAYLLQRNGNLFLGSASLRPVQESFGSQVLLGILQTWYHLVVMERVYLTLEHLLPML